MAIRVLRPNAAGDLTMLTPDPGQTNWNNASDASDLTGNYGTGDGKTDLYQVANLPVSSSGVVQIDLHFRIHSNFPPDWGFTPLWKLGGVQLQGITRVCPVAPTTFVEAAIARPGGGAWTVADANALQIGARLDQLDIGPPAQSYLVDEWLAVDAIEAAIVPAHRIASGQAPTLRLASGRSAARRAALGTVDARRVASARVASRRTRSGSVPLPEA